MIDQTARNTAQPANLSRAAVAPVISAGVITANIIWYATKASAGIVTPAATRERRARAASRPISPNSSRSPNRPLPVSSPNAMV